MFAKYFIVTVKTESETLEYYGSEFEDFKPAMIAIKMNFNDPLEVSSNGYIDRAQITAIPGMLVYQDGEVIVDYSHSVQMPKMQSDNLDDVNLEKSIDANMTKAQILLTLIVIFCCLASTSLKYMWILIHFC